MARLAVSYDNRVAFLCTKWEHLGRLRQHFPIVGKLHYPFPGVLNRLSFTLAHSVYVYIKASAYEWFVGIKSYTLLEN
jgi:hypothetical protein